MRKIQRAGERRGAPLLVRSHPPLTPFFISSLAAGVAPLSRKRSHDGRIILRRHVRSILSAKKFGASATRAGEESLCAHGPRRNINTLYALAAAALSGARAKRVSLLNIIAVRDYRARRGVSRAVCERIDKRQVKLRQRRKKEGDGVYFTTAMVHSTICRCL